MLAGLCSCLAMLLAAAQPASMPPRDAKVIISGIDRRFDWRTPLKPEPWWPIGGAIFAYFDHTIIVARGRDVSDLVSNIETSLSDRGFRGISRIEVWTHGGPGYFRLQQRRWFADLFMTADARVREPLERLRGRLCDGAVVHFRSCSTFQGPMGRTFAAAAQRFFTAGGRNVIVMGHTRPTGLTHPGWRTLYPACSPDWSLRDGGTESALEGGEIIVRDFARILTGGLYDAAIHTREISLPALLRTLPEPLLRMADRPAEARE